MTAPATEAGDLPSQGRKWVSSGLQMMAMVWGCRPSQVYLPHCLVYGRHYVKFKETFAYFHLEA